MRCGNLRPWVLAAGAGLALALALPGVSAVPLVLLVPGLLRRAIAGASGRQALLRGFFAGWVQWMVSVPWVVIVLSRYGHVPKVAAALALVLMSAILGVTWALAAWAASRVPPVWRVWVLPLALVTMEVLQAYPPWGFPWNPIAAVATAWPFLLAPVTVVGSAGLSLLILLVGAGVDGLADRATRGTAAWTFAVAVAMVGGTAALSPRFQPSDRPALTVAALQPDVPLEVRWDPENLGAIEERVWNLCDEAAASGATWIVWPESAIPRLVERDAGFRSRLEAFARTRGVWMTVGSIGLGSGDEYFNSIFTVSPTGLCGRRYDKIHLVPFGEYVPVLGRFRVLRPLVREVGSFSPGDDPRPVVGPAGPTGLAVCYEVAFPSLAAAEVEHGATVLATITNDGWYGDSAAPRQHLALARLRAAETRRFMVRAANTGISAVIDPYGNLVTILGVGQQGMVVESVTPGTGTTGAVVAGGYVRLLLVVAAFGAILVGSRRQTAEHVGLHGGSSRGEP